MERPVETGSYMVKKAFISVLLLSLLALPGCGGGGDSSSVTWTGGDGGGDGDGDGGGGGGGGATLDLSWNPVTTYANGAALSPHHYRVYIGYSPGSYAGYAETADSTASISVTGLASGTYYISITAWDAYGNEGDYSEEVIKPL